LGEPSGTDGKSEPSRLGGGAGSGLASPQLELEPLVSECQPLSTGWETPPQGSFGANFSVDEAAPGASGDFSLGLEPALNIDDLEPPAAKCDVFTVSLSVRKRFRMNQLERAGH
jgi:hypothetical protein